jgi:hypothetical protein
MQLIFFKEEITVYYENYTNHIDTLCVQIADILMCTDTDGAQNEDCAAAEGKVLLLLQGRNFLFLFRRPYFRSQSNEIRIFLVVEMQWRTFSGFHEVDY